MVDANEDTYMNNIHTHNDALLIKQWLIQRKVKDAPGSHPLMDAANRILTRLCHPRAAEQVGRAENMDEQHSRM